MKGAIAADLGPVSTRFVQSLGPGQMLARWIQGPTRVLETLITVFLPQWQMCYMDVGYLEWVQRAVWGTHMIRKEQGCGEVGALRTGLGPESRSIWVACVDL